MSKDLLTDFNKMKKENWLSEENVIFGVRVMLLSNELA